MQSIIVFNETLTYLLLNEYERDEWMPCCGKTWLQLFVPVCIIITLFEATFSKSIDRMEFHRGIVEQNFLVEC